MKIKGFIVSVCITAGIFVISGCQEQSQAKAPQASEPLCLGLYDKVALMHAAKDTLEAKKFTIEKFDIENGYIVTRPMRGSQFFEIWRGDNVGAENAGMSNLHSLQRIVEVELLSGDSDWCVSCYAHLQRLSMNNEKEGTMADSYARYTSSSTSIMKLTPDINADIDWIEMGRDTALENDILQKIKLNVTQVAKQ